MAGEGSSKTPVLQALEDHAALGDAVDVEGGPGAAGGTVLTDQEGPQEVECVIGIAQVQTAGLQVVAW
jgi:hypothetical protein